MAYTFGSMIGDLLNTIQQLISDMSIQTYKHNIEQKNCSANEFFFKKS